MIMGTNMVTFRGKAQHFPGGGGECKLLSFKYIKHGLILMLKMYKKFDYPTTMGYVAHASPNSSMGPHENHIFKLAKT